MLRNFSKLNQPSKWAALTVRKQYGVLARAAVGDDQSVGSATRKDTFANIEKYIEKYDRYFAYKTEAPNKIHVNVEELNKELQTVFVDRYLGTLKKLLDDNEITSISFNFISEDVFRCILNMAIRKLGYSSSFQRYNDDRGLAVFKLKSNEIENVDLKRIGAYHRMAYTKSRKTDILNLIM